MADAWDESDDDEWDVDDDEIAKKLGMASVQQNLPTFDDDVDLAVQERQQQAQAQAATLKKKGNALASKKLAEEAKKKELELARKAMQAEAEAEAKMTPGELRAHKNAQEYEASESLADDLFGEKTSDAERKPAGEVLVLKTMKDHLKHALTVATALREHGKTHFATAFFREALQQSKDVLDDDAVGELIKTLNVIKNEKVQAAKRKVKGQAQKSKKDKAAEAKARKIQQETFGDNDDFDDYDEMGGAYEDAFF